MPTQNIDFSAVGSATFNGTELSAINLNGTEIWSAGGFTRTVVVPSVYSKTQGVVQDYLEHIVANDPIPVHEVANNWGRHIIENSNSTLFYIFYNMDGTTSLAMSIEMPNGATPTSSTYPVLRRYGESDGGSGGFGNICRYSVSVNDHAATGLKQPTSYYEGFVDSNGIGASGWWFFELGKILDDGTLQMHGSGSINCQVFANYVWNNWTYNLGITTDGYSASITRNTFFGTSFVYTYKLAHRACADADGDFKQMYGNQIDLPNAIPVFDCTNPNWYSFPSSYLDGYMDSDSSLYGMHPPEYFERCGVFRA